MFGICADDAELVVEGLMAAELEVLVCVDRPLYTARDSFPSLSLVVRVSSMGIFLSVSSSLVYWMSGSMELM